MREALDGLEPRNLTALSRMAAGSRLTASSRRNEGASVCAVVQNMRGKSCVKFSSAGPHQHRSCVSAGVSQQHRSSSTAAVSSVPYYCSHTVSAAIPILDTAHYICDLVALHQRERGSLVSLTHRRPCAPLATRPGLPPPWRRNRGRSRGPWRP